MGARWVRCTASWCSCKPDVHVASSHYPPTGCPADTRWSYVFNVRLGRILTVISILVLVGSCGESHPSADSPDDTHSVLEVRDRAPTTSSVEPFETSIGGMTKLTESAVETIGATTADNAGAPTSVPIMSSESNVTVPTAQTSTTTFTSPATVIPVVIPCDAVPGASCAGADLRGQEFPYANLQGVDFTGAILNGVDFTGADLSGANFTGANLTSANLSETVLFGTDFTGVRLTRTNLQYVLWDDSTIWPSGFTPPDF